MEVNDELRTSIPLSRNLLGGLLIGLQSQSYSAENGKSYQVCRHKAIRCLSVELTKSVYGRVKRRTLLDLRLLFGSCLDLSNGVLLGLLCQVSVPVFRRKVLPSSSE